MAKFYDQLKRRLEEQRARLAREIKDTEDPALLEMTPTDDRGYGNHLADDATATYQQEENLAVKQHLNRELQAVDAALRRMREGTYGVCESCGGPIGRERLQALPTATLCMACKTRGERRR